MRRRAFLSLTLLLISTICWPLEGEECIGHCAKAFANNALPLVGDNNNERTITIYLGDYARQTKSKFFSGATIQAAINRWANDCKGSYPGLPQFAMNLEGEPPARDPKSEEINEILIIEVDPGAAPMDGKDTHPASHSWNEITIYEKCPSNPQHSLECSGDSIGYIRWNEPWGTQALAHEIGHALGLNHDEGSCARSVMSAVTGWKEGNLKLTKSHCELASRLNDTSGLCAWAPNTGTNMCERCERTIGGSADGLEEGDRVTLVAEVSYSALNAEGVPAGKSKTLRTVAYGIGSFSFVEEVMEGASYSVSVESIDDPDKSCSVVQGASGVVGSEDITSVQIECPVRPATVWRRSRK